MDALLKQRQQSSSRSTSNKGHEKKRLRKKDRLRRHKRSHSVAVENGQSAVEQQQRSIAAPDAPSPPASSQTSSQVSPPASPSQPLQPSQSEIVGSSFVSIDRQVIAQSLRAVGSTTPQSKRPKLGLALQQTQQQNQESSASIPRQSVLHEKWYGTAKIRELEGQGVAVRHGPFSVSEDEVLQSKVAEFLEINNLSGGNEADVIRKLIYSKKNASQSGGDGQYLELRSQFWSHVSMPFPTRTLRAIYHRLCRLYHPLNSRDRWEPQELMRLENLVSDFGNDWQKIGALLGRMPENCRTRYKALKGAKKVTTTAEGEEIQQSASGRQSSRRWDYSDERLLLQIMVARLRKDNQHSSIFPAQSLLEWINCKYKEWSKVETEFAQGNPKLVRSMDNLRLKWRCVMVPYIYTIVESMMANCGDDSVSLYTSIDELAETISKQKSRSFTPEIDRLIIDTLEEKFPRANYMQDINWAHVVDVVPEFRYWNEMRIDYRFHQLIKRFVPADNPLRLHLTKKAIDTSSMGNVTTPPLHNVYSILKSSLNVVD